MERVAIPPLMIVPLAIAHSTIIKGGYPEVSLRLMLWRKEKMLWRRGLRRVEGAATGVAA